KVRGYRIEPGEIAAVLCEHSAVRDALVMAADDASGSKQLVAYVVPATAGSGSELTGPTEVLTTATLRAHLRSRLPQYMIPAAFVLLEAFPLNANGKIDRRALPPPTAERACPPAGTDQALTATEAALAEIWQSMLNVEAVGVNDSFFDLGGHSLMA